MRSIVSRRAVLTVAMGLLIALSATGVSHAVPMPYNGTDLRLWLRADAGLTLDTVTYPDRVLGWADQTGIGGNVTGEDGVGPGGARPLWVADGINGQPALWFDTTARRIDGPAVLPAGNGARTIFVVANYTNPNPDGNGDHNRIIFDPAGQTPSAQNSTGALFRITPEIRVRFGNGNVNFGNPVGSGAAIITAGLPAGGTHMDTVLYKNGTPLSHGSSSTNPINTTTAGYRMGTAGYKGYIAEVMVFEALLPQAEIDKVGSYLAGKYGIAHSFAGDEIYWDNSSTDVVSPVSPPYPGDNLWMTPSNWRANNSDPMDQFPNDTLPGPTDRVNISLHDVAADPPAPCNVEAGDDLLVNSVRVGGNFGLGVGGHGVLNINGGTLTIADNGGVGVGGQLEIAGTGNRNGAVNLNGGTLNVEGDIITGANPGSGKSSLTINGGTLNMVNDGSITVDSFTMGNVADSAMTHGGDLTVSGKMLLGAHNANIKGDYTQTGGTVSVGDEFAVSGGGTYTMNAGRLEALGGKDFRISLSRPGTFTQNGGTVEVTPNTNRFLVGAAAVGTYNMNGAGAQLTVHGTILIANNNSASGSTFNQNAGTVAIDDNLQFGRAGLTPTGTYNLKGGTLSIAGAILDAGATSKLNISGGSLDMVNDGAITVDKMDIGNGSNGTLALDSDLTVKGLWRIGIGSKGTLTQTGGLITHTANDFNVGQTGGQGGFYEMQGGTLNPSGSFFRVGASGYGEFNHAAGTVTVDANNFLIGGNNVGVYNLSGAGATLTRVGDEVLGNNTQAKGTMNHSAGTHHITRDLKIANNASANNFGKYFMTGGSLDVDRHLRNGAVNGATGTFGVLGTGPTAINIDGNFTQNDVSTLLIGLGAVSPHVTPIDVGGIATLDGLLEVALLDGFQPNYGDTFDVLTAAGGVTAADLEVVGHPFFYHSIVDNGTTLQVTYVPEPTTMALLVLGGLGLAARRRRR